MYKIWFVTLALAASLMAVHASATACGESLFRVGNGVQYRGYFAPIPGSVLVYAQTDDELMVAEELQLAGHSVRVVGNDLDLALTIQEQQFDVLIAPYSKRETIEAQSVQLATHPDWVPVVEHGSPDEKLAKAQYGHTVYSGDDVRKYLKAIHQNLKEGSG